MRRRTMLAGVAAGAVLAVMNGPVLAEGGAALEPLISVAALRERLGEAGLVIVDIRGRSADDAFGDGHIPGAVWSRYPGGWRGVGDIPGAVPTKAALEAQIGGLGITPRSRVVVVPAGTGATEFGGAARVYWTLKYAGLEEVAILDGGWKAWLTEGDNPVETGTASPEPVEFVADINDSILATTEMVEDRNRFGVTLIDARAPEFYDGETKAAQAREAGHIPGAINLPNTMFYDEATDRLKPRERMARLVPTLLADDGAAAILYCNAGHWSATNWFVLHELLGYPATALYVDSIIGWTQDPHHRVER